MVWGGFALVVGAVPLALASRSSSSSSGGSSTREGRGGDHTMGGGCGNTGHGTIYRIVII